jgi:hypothetical protein
VNFARVHNVPVKVARPFNNYGPGLKITDRRVIPDFVRDVLNGRDIVMLSDGSPMRTFCYVADAVVGYYKVLVNGRPARHTTSGSRPLRFPWPTSPSGSRASGRDLFGYTGRVVRQASADGRLPRRQPQPPLPDHHQGAHRGRLRTHVRPRRRAAPFDALVRGQPRRRGRLMRVSVVGTGYVGLVTAACFAEAGMRSCAWTAHRTESAQVRARQAPFHDPACRSSSRRSTWARTLDLAQAVRDTDVTLICVGTPFDGKRIDLSYVEAVAAEIGAALARKDDYHVVIVKVDGRAGDDRDRRCAVAGEALRQARGCRLRRGHEPEFLSEGTAGARRPRARSHRARRHRRAHLGRDGRAYTSPGKTFPHI